MIEIRRIDRRLHPGGTWVAGTVGNYQFNALVFREHAVNPDFELANSRISKLWINYQGVVFNWDRGPDIPPANEEVEDVVVLLCSELAKQVCVDVGDRIRLVAMDDIDPVPIHATGTVHRIGDHDGWLQVDIDWDNGRRLMLSLPPDRVSEVSNATEG